MRLFKVTWENGLWLARVVKLLLLAHPILNLVVIGASATSRVAKLLAFLLPLKVILLAGSDGVPRYFTFFIDETQKSVWILWLASAAIISYTSAILLDVLIKSLSRKGASHVLEKGGKVGVLSRQHTVAKNYYEKITQLSAATIFVFVGCIALGIVNAALLIFLVSVSLLIFFLTALLVNNGKQEGLGKQRGLLVRIKIYLEESYRGYVSIASSVVFLSSFLFILYPYLDPRIDNSNLLFSLFSLIVMRQCVKASSYVVNNFVSLSEDKEKVTALFFKKKYYDSGERKDKKEIRKYFHPESRRQLIERQLHGYYGERVAVASYWRDSPWPGVSYFEVYEQGCDCEMSADYLLQVFHHRFQHLVDKERLLFSYVDRAKLNAAECLSSESLGGFKTQLIRYGHSLRPAIWREKKLDLFRNLWAIQPPQKLVNIYRKSHPLMQDRITAEMISRLSIAADRDHESVCVKKLLDNVDVITGYIKTLPLYFHNPDMRIDNVAGVIEKDKDENCKILFWGRWSLQPIGIEIMDGLDDAELSEIIEWIKSKRKDISSIYGVREIRLAQQFWAFEGAVKQGKYSQAIMIGDEILKILAQIRDASDIGKAKLG